MMWITGDKLSSLGRVLQRASDDEDQEEDGLCNVCLGLDLGSIFNRKREKHVKYSLKRVQKLESQNCPLCRLMFRRLPHGQIVQNGEERRPGQPFITTNAKLGCLQISYAGQHRGVIRKASFCSPEELRRDHASELDYSLIMSWLNECEVKHGDNCNLREFATLRYRFPTDIVLIDTLEHRLIEGQSDLRYAALSYVWGGVRMLTTTTKNFPSLQRRGALHPDRKDLPNVVQDAMKLTHMLGERYLWVDCLCIEQDSAQKHQEIAQMDIIYTHAHFTIVAVDGDNANAPLPGIRARSRSPVRPVIRIRGQQLTSEPPSLDWVLKSSTYDTRGWTLQERALSRRRLYMSEQQVYFQCNVLTRSEIQLEGDKLQKSTTSRINDLRIRGSSGLGPELTESLYPGSTKRYWFDGLPIYQELVEIYSARNLSYTEDVANAFGGFSSVFEECCGGMFISCIPTAALSASLLWIPKGVMSRRIGQSGSSFPSWSWAGWLGTAIYRTASRGETNAPSENLELEMDELEIFVKEAPTDSVVKQVNDLGQVIISDVGIIQDVSLHKPRYIQMKHLSMLRFPDDRDIYRKFLSIVDTLRFKTWFARPRSVKYMPARSSCIDQVVQICAKENQTPYGVLFGIKHADLDCLESDQSHKLIAISHDATINSWEELVDFYDIPPPTSDRYIKRDKVLNVMLIREEGPYSERVAIGKVFYDYWRLLKYGYTTFLLV